MAQPEKRATGMTLSDWRTSKGWTVQRLADELEIDISFAMRLLNGKRRPGPDLYERIFMMTDGQVTPNDFFPVARWRDALEAVWAKARELMRLDAA